MKGIKAFKDMLCMWAHSPEVWAARHTGPRRCAYVGSTVCASDLWLCRCPRQFALLGKDTEVGTPISALARHLHALYAVCWYYAVLNVAVTAAAAASRAAQHAGGAVCSKRLCAIKQHSCGNHEAPVSTLANARHAVGCRLAAALLLLAAVE